MEAIVRVVQPSKEGCKDRALSNQPLGSSLATCASHRQDHHALIVLMEKKINGDNNPSTQPAVLMGNKSVRKCHCTEGAVWGMFL